ncbi:MAG: hypothetical protein K6G60_05990 [Lachnospiraceae bacterium]|nr:hypothetical protein [Lachnospiraceae bacterium]
MTEYMAFFAENDKKMSEKMAKILVWMTLVFPALFGLSALGVFNIPLKTIAIITPFACICTFGPTIALKFGTPIPVMKYMSIIAIGIVVGMLGSQWTIGIYMTYGLAMAFSCLYFDPKFTLRISVISFVLLVISMYIRSIDIPQLENETNLQWFISKTAGYLMEQVVMTIVFMSITKASRMILENLHAKEQTAEIITKCGNASGELVNMIGELEGSIVKSREANGLIISSAQNTANGCEESREQVKAIQESVSEMGNLIEGIYDHTGDITKVSEDIAARTEEVIETMDIAAESMKTIEETSNLTGDSITELESGIQEIVGFVGKISGISAQTNLLALNASIEAARAGEQGKGFAVVAENVRQLAEDSKKATDAIRELVERVGEKLEGVKTTNEQNVESVQSGIEKIYGAKERTASLSEIQQTLNEKTDEISERTGATRKHSEVVKDLAQQLDHMVAGFSEHADEIMEEAKNESSITNATEETFKQVKNIADELKDLSRVEI